MTFDLFCAKSEEKLKDFPDNHFDSCVCDSPYGISFMGKHWDHGVPSVELWAEVFRVLKPGAHLISFGGTRTHHRIVCAIEDAGFEIRDTLMWVFGSGFPKSHNLEGEWSGWGTALKPAFEPICLARKPIEKGLTVAQNVQKWGTGALNIDGCRVETDPNVDDMLRQVTRGERKSETWKDGSGFKNEANSLTGVPESGRWPANLIHDGSDEVTKLFPESDGQQGDVTGKEQSKPGESNMYSKFNERQSFGARNDSGSAARFFYCPKTSRADRNEGCEHLGRKPLNWSSGTQNPGSFQAEGTDRSSPNNHPTVKPTELMQYLCRLVTPPKGLILDHFTGSGSTGKAAMIEGFNFVGIDQDQHSIEIARCRIQFILDRLDLFGVFIRP